MKDENRNEEIDKLNAMKANETQDETYLLPIYHEEHPLCSLNEQWTQPKLQSQERQPHKYCSHSRP